MALQEVSHLIGCRAHLFPQVCCEMKTINRENSAAANSATRWTAMATTPSGFAPSDFARSTMASLENGDLYDGRTHEGGCILGQHVAC